MPHKDPEARRAYRLRYERERAKDPTWRANKSAVARTRRALKPETLAYRLWRSARERATEKGWTFDIRPKDISIPEVCPLLGVRIVAKKGRGPSAASPSLDRVDSSKGYTRDNVWVISYRANAIKQNATPEELEAIAAGVRRRLCLGLRSLEPQHTGS